MESEINMAASKHATKREVNGVQCFETRPRDHTFTSGHTPNKYNIIEPIDTNFNMQTPTIHRDINQKDTHNVHTSHLHIMIQGVSGDYKYKAWE
jgi:hypothetical protein